MLPKLRVVITTTTRRTSTATCDGHLRNRQQRHRAPRQRARSRFRVSSSSIQSKADRTVARACISCTQRPRHIRAFSSTFIEKGGFFFSGTHLGARRRAPPRCLMLFVRRHTCRRAPQKAAERLCASRATASRQLTPFASPGGKALSDNPHSGIFRPVPWRCGARGDLLLA